VEIYRKTFGYDWNMLKTLRTELEPLIGTYIENEEHQNAVIMGVSELCENIIKYAKDKTGGELIISEEEEKDTYGKITHLKAITINDATEDAVEILQDEMEGLDNPHNAIAEYQLRIVATSIDDEHSRLGLIRIVAEAQGVISFEWNDPKLILTTIFPVEPVELILQ
jgi:NADH/NAD ratio-sensing transcriptional regulator Rex